MRALVIDDSKPVRRILARMLRELNFETTEAENGQEGLDRLREIGSADVATVNWQMPVMDGLQFIRTVRADATFRNLPLLMISSESEPAKVATALAAGASDYIVKPCTQRTLSEKLTKLGLATERHRRAGMASAEFQRPVKKIGVMIVDDALIVRRVVTSVLNDDPDLEVVGTASDGRIALQQLEAVDPDVILLDVEMPNLNGLDTLRELRKRQPRLPVIMFSSLTERGAAVTTNALFLGADDYVAKPGGTHMTDLSAGKHAIREQLIPKIKQLSLRNRQVQRVDQVVGAIPLKSGTPSRIDLVAIAVSTGGPCALANLLPSFTIGFTVPILIVQHMPPLFTKHLAVRLAAIAALNVQEASERELLRPGMVRVAPGGFHMTVAGPAHQAQLRLNQKAPVNGCRPSADVLFQSVADVYGNAVLGVVLTGMGSDGLLGCKRLSQAGAQILAQDEATSVVWGMPGQIARAGLASQVLPLDQLGHEINRRAKIGR